MFLVLYTSNNYRYTRQNKHPAHNNNNNNNTLFGDTKVFKLLVKEIRPLFQEDRRISVPREVDVGESGGSSLSSSLSLVPFWPAVERGAGMSVNVRNTLSQIT